MAACGSTARNRVAPRAAISLGETLGAYFGRAEARPLLRVVWAKLSQTTPPRRVENTARVMPMALSDSGSAFCAARTVLRARLLASATQGGADRTYCLDCTSPSNTTQYLVTNPLSCR